jgi:hypothetical protein
MSDINTVLHRDILNHILSYCIGSGVVLVCKLWADIIGGAIARGEYAEVIAATYPATLPSSSFAWLTFEQKTKLPMCIRRRLEAISKSPVHILHLKPMYSITWREIMNHCRATMSCTWLCDWHSYGYFPKQPWVYISEYSTPTIYEEYRKLIHLVLFLECEQYREYAMRFQDGHDHLAQLQTLAASWPIDIHVNGNQPFIMIAFYTLKYSLEEHDADEYSKWMSDTDFMWYHGLC